jgi:hypothetical protein
MYNKIMVTLPNNRAEAYSVETFQCGNCDKDFEAKVITWVDVSRTPEAKRALRDWQFNIVQCTHCGCRDFSGTPFFYEDFEEGLLVAVFPGIPDGRGDIERSIREKYGYYPALEFFYDMTQIWMLIYFLERDKANKKRAASRTGSGAERLRMTLHFLKEDPLMLDIREKLTESFFGHEAKDELADVLGRAAYTLDGTLPWPLDRRCLCGADLTDGLECCGNRLRLDGHAQVLSRHYMLYCPACAESFSGASCRACGRAYTWKLGIVDSHLDSPARNDAAPVRQQGP